MNIHIYRKYKKESYTIGRLFIDGQFVCNTLEPKDRGLDQQMSVGDIRMCKVRGLTAIPLGRYKVEMSWSVKFKERRPFLIDVPCYTGVMIHEGNTVRSTMGCILVGMNTVKGCVMESKRYLAVIMKKICEAGERGEEIQLTIYN